MHASHFSYHHHHIHLAHANPGSYQHPTTFSGISFFGFPDHSGSFCLSWGLARIVPWEKFLWQTELLQSLLSLSLAPPVAKLGPSTPVSLQPNVNEESLVPSWSRLLPRLRGQVHKERGHGLPLHLLRGP